MSRFLKALLSVSAVCAMGASAFAEPLGLGRAATEAEIAAWDIDIRPDGLGLPEGRGNVEVGEELFAEQCASCHGDFGEGVDRWPVLAGGAGTLSSDDPVKTIGSYWPYLSTVYDYVHRAMPFGNAQSLSDDEVYAITAYLLYVNDLVEDDFELSHENFAQTRLPNEENFFADDRPQSPLFAPREVCMRDCKTDVKITARARVLDVTPDQPASAETAQAAPEASAPEAPPSAPAFNAELAAAGAKVFRKCKSCHQLGPKAKHRTGPILTGVVGAQMGAIEGFSKYSKALKAKGAEGAVWDEENLHAFLEKPKKWLKGTKMNFAGLKKEQERAAIIEYLKSYAE